ncbi:MAG: energy-coupling factor transporter transmembrane component T [Pseudomonadota bacterium]
MLSLTTERLTPFHAWPAGPKLLAICFVTAVLFIANELWLTAVVCCAVFGLYALPGTWFLHAGVSKLWVLWPFMVILALWHGITGTPVEGIGIALRLLAVLALANLVTLTTRLEDMADVVIQLAQPIRLIGMRPERLGLALALVIRFTPILAERSTRLIEAWRARSRRRPGWILLAPFSVAALDDATHVAEALRARGGLDGQKE